MKAGAGGELRREKGEGVGRRWREMRRGRGNRVKVTRGGDIRRETDGENKEREWEMGDGRESGRYKERV